MLRYYIIPDSSGLKGEDTHRMNMEDGQKILKNFETWAKQES